jgi:hypothetical protein
MKISAIVLHHTATRGAGDGSEEWNSIISLCKQRRGSPYICDYHYGVGPYGALLTGQPLSSPCWHCGDDSINNASLAVACIGNFEDRIMPSAQRVRLIQLIRDLKTQHPDAKIMFHKEIVPTLCPGKHYPYSEINNLLLPSLRFRDVPTSNIFYPAIEVVAQKGIIKGDTEGTFRPGDPVTRGELAQVMVNFLTQAGEI